MALIELEHVCYRYEDSAVPALDGLDLKIEAGEFVLLAGASGSGKSTLCRLLNGLIPHFHGGHLEGQVRVDGLATREHPVHKLFARVGLVFQNPEAQLFNSTVARELAFGLESLGLPRGEIRSRVDWALRVACLEALRERASHSLSGGEQQAVAVAAILALRPRVLVLDEPFANLDPQAVDHICAILREAHAQGATVLVAEHRLHAVLQDATRLIVLNGGRVVRDGPPREILRENLSPMRLNVPFAVRFGRESGWDGVPLSVEEAVAMARLRPDVAGAMPHERWDAEPAAAPESAPAVEVSDVWFSRERSDILRGVRFAIARGECVALVGKNGSGKTTLLKHLNALNRPARGAVLILGRDIRNACVSDLARQVGLVFQNPNAALFKSSVREEIEVAPRALNHFDGPWIERLYSQFGLQPLLDRSPFILSEGEKKRVAIAAALAAQPQIVALDEPTAGQDDHFRAALARLLRELQSEGVALLLATHDLEFAEEVAPRWIVLADGEVVADGAPETVMQNAEAMARAALRPTGRFRLRDAFSGRVSDAALVREVH